jgi:hypothetical protein
MVFLICLGAQVVAELTKQIPIVKEKSFKINIPNIFRHKSGKQQ